MIVKPKKSSKGIIDSDGDDKEEEPGKGSDSEGDGGLDERAATRKIMASSSDEEDDRDPIQ